MNELAILSLLISLIFAELFGLSPGGVIVPFYFALYIDDGTKVLATLITAVLSIAMVKFLSRFTILYGRRRFTMYIAAGILLKILFTYFYFGTSYMFFNLSLTIGYLVPGILGREMERQGIIKTGVCLFTVVLIISLVRLLIS